MLLPACWLPLLLCTPSVRRSLRDCQGNFGCSALSPSCLFVAFGLFLLCPSTWGLYWLIMWSVFSLSFFFSPVICLLFSSKFLWIFRGDVLAGHLLKAYTWVPIACLSGVQQGNKGEGNWVCCFLVLGYQWCVLWCDGCGTCVTVCHWLCWESHSVTGRSCGDKNPFRNPNVVTTWGINLCKSWDNTTCIFLTNIHQYLFLKMLVRDFLKSLSRAVLPSFGYSSYRL